MRVTQRTMYSNIINYSNRALSALQESNLQSITEKKVNRPSDDPAGTANIYSLRASLTSIDNYSTNASTAKGWLSLADGVLQQVSTMITDAKTKDLQGSTGTVSSENRDQIATQLRQIYEQLIVAANTSFNGQYIFSGHKTDTAPYEKALNAMSYDENLDGVEYEVSGDSSHSAVVQFLSDGVIGTDALDYRYSTDGGSTWKTGTLAAGDNELDLGGVIVTMHNSNGKSVTAVDTNNSNENENGSWLWVYPTAKYVGDDEDQIWVDSYSSSGAAATAQGTFSREVVVRVDNVGSGAITYSYSTDAGNTWKEGNSSNINGTEARVLVPGGYLNLDLSGGTPVAGDQFFIRSRRAEIKLNIAQGETLAINNIGKNIFGGIYQDPDPTSTDDYAKAVYDGDGRNLLETMGRLIAFAENNNQEGFQKELAKLEDAHNIVLTADANVGGRLNRATTATETLQTIGDSETQALSNIEDVDFVELMTKIAQQELVYQSVLKSSSMLMQLSLLNFI